MTVFIFLRHLSLVIKAVHLHETGIQDLQSGRIIQAAGDDLYVAGAGMFPRLLHSRIQLAVRGSSGSEPNAAGKAV
jgi:hypothetical protein